MVNNPCWFVMLKSNKFFFSPPNRSPTLSINQRQTLTWKVTRTCCIIGTTESNNFSWVVTYVCNRSVFMEVYHVMLQRRQDIENRSESMNEFKWTIIINNWPVRGLQTLVNSLSMPEPQWWPVLEGEASKWVFLLVSILSVTFALQHLPWKAEDSLTHDYGWGFLSRARFFHLDNTIS